MNKTCIALLTAILATWHAASALCAPIYQLTPLGFLPGRTDSWAFAINSSSEIVGTSGHAFLWTKSGGMQDFLGSGGTGIAISDSGTIVGSAPIANTSNSPGASGAFLWTATGGMQALGTLGNASEADAISSDGTIVGWSTLKSGFRAPFIWTALGGMKQLGTVTNAIALGINSSGQVVGSSDSGLHVPYLWDAKTGSIQNLGTLGKSEGAATAINTAGQVVGWIDSDLFIWTQAGGMRDLGHLGSGVANNPAINDLGQVVGSYTFATGGGSGFIWSQATGMRDLKSLVDSSANGWSLGRPMSINNVGQIVGVGTDRSGFNEAFLLTPLPEPSSLFLFAIGVLAIGGAATCRRHSRSASECLICVRFDRRIRGL
jgi:probable HAF family extracellular repeat protein